MKHFNIRLSYYLIALAAVCLTSGCSSPGTLVETGMQEKPDYSITYIIHGDADYLYHDSLGTARQADEKVLEEAIRVGEKAKHGEVFIFHQRPEKKILWLFPKKDRQFLYYRRGKLIAKKRYSPPGKNGSGIFQAEAGLMETYGDPADSIKPGTLLYFGHEIPYKNGEGYYRSMPGIAMNTDTFRAGINRMLPQNRDRFDLVVLSTCNNGTPDMVHALKPLTRFLLASPQNLHLSHIDTQGLLMLEKEAESGPKEVAERLSRDTYRRLANTVQTVVSLSVFNMQEVSGYIEQVDSAYRTYLQTGMAGEPGAENTDCADLSIFHNQIAFSQGVSVRYKPPRFGRNAGQRNHSGWGCKEKVS